MKTKIKVTKKVMMEIENIAFERYPELESGCFFNAGFCFDEEHGLLLTITDVLVPKKGDLNDEVGNVQFQEPYILRTALGMQDTGRAVGVIHSHPENCGVWPSSVDDEMDGYFSRYFGDFGPGRPFASLILSKSPEKKIRFGGRAWYQGKWHEIESLVIVGETVEYRHGRIPRKPLPEIVLKRLARLTGAFGPEAAQRLWESTAVVMGAGGTGSAVAHSLARSCVGRIVLIDTDDVDYHNSERGHGCGADHLAAEKKPSKVQVLKELINRINPEIEVIAIKGNALQKGAREFLAHADILFGCSDSEHGRADASETSYLYLVPAFQVNVALESAGNVLAAEVVQFTRYLPGLPCAYCHEQVDSTMLAFELMTAEERSERKQQAEEAVARGERGDPYWRGAPVIHTVGSLTTLAAELAVNYAVGTLTGAYAPKSNFLEFDLLAPFLGVATAEVASRESCACSKRIGYADQTPEGRFLNAPDYWAPPHDE